MTNQICMLSCSHTTLDKLQGLQAQGDQVHIKQNGNRIINVNEGYVFSNETSTI